MFFLIKNILKGKFIIFSILFMIPSLAALIFFRAMIIFTLVLSILLTVLLSGSLKKKFSIALLVSILVAGILIIWGNVSSSGFTNDFNDYFGRRLTVLGSEEKLAGENSTLSKKGYVGLVSAPLFIVMSPLLPIPAAILFEDPKYPSTNIDFSGNLFLYAILPVALIGLINAFKFRKNMIFPFLLLLFFIVYKFGSAASGMSIWSYRQNLPSTLALLMLFPIGLDAAMTTWENRARKILLFLSFSLILIWSGFRYIIRL